MDPPPPPKPKSKGLPRAVRSILITGIVFLVFAVFVWPLLRISQESARRTACLSNVKWLILGITQYAIDRDGVYPWRIGATEPKDAWRDLGLLFPDYVSESKPFYCPSSRDWRGETERAFFGQMRDKRQRGETELSPIPGGNSRVVISYSYSYNAVGVAPEGAAIAPQPWGDVRSSTARLLADKKAGVPMTPQANHWRSGSGGRNVAYRDGHVRWKHSPDALDPDEESNAIGARRADDYSEWWSDPPYYGE